VAKAISVQLDENKALRLQLALAAKENFELKVRQALKDAQTTLNKAWVDAGLELGVEYDLNFHTLTATRVPKKAGK
jgi:hypothetical protein